MDKYELRLPALGPGGISWWRPRLGRNWQLAPVAQVSDAGGRAAATMAPVLRVSWVRWCHTPITLPLVHTVCRGQRKLKAQLALLLLHK